MRAAFVVRTPVYVELDAYLAQVRAGVVVWERIGSVELTRGRTPGWAELRSVVDAGDRMLAGRTVRQALMTAVRSVGPLDAWRAWWSSAGPAWIASA